MDWARSPKEVGPLLKFLFYEVEVCGGTAAVVDERIGEREIIRSPACVHDELVRRVRASEVQVQLNALADGGDAGACALYGNQAQV